MSSTRQGFLRHEKIPPGLFRRGLNLWPPFFGAGVRVTRMSEDYREVEPVFHVAIVDEDGETVAEVDNTLYIRRQRDDATPCKRTARARA